MSFKLINYYDATKYHNAIQNIYYSAFDPRATMNFKRIKKLMDLNKAIMYIAIDDERLLGFIYIYFYNNIA